MKTKFCWESALAQSNAINNRLTNYHHPLKAPQITFHQHPEEVGETKVIEEGDKEDASDVARFASHLENSTEKAVMICGLNYRYEWFTGGIIEIGSICINVRSGDLLQFFSVNNLSRRFSIYIYAMAHK